MEVIDSSKQQTFGGDTAVDIDVTMTIRQLPSHLQSMVTLLAKMVSSSKEGKLREKKGKDTLVQAASMMMEVCITPSLFGKFFF